MTAAPVRSTAVVQRVALLIAPKAVTNIIIGGLGPAACFLVGRRAGGLVAAVALCAGWNCFWQALRWIRRKPFSGLLIIGLLELGLRTTLGLAMHSARMFFLAPAIATALTGFVYIGSTLLGRPLIATVLADLVPLSLVDLSQLRVRQIMRAISIIYGAEQVIVAAISILMVLTLSTPEYVAVHMAVSWSLFALVTSAGIALFRRDVVQLLQPAN